MCPHCEAGEHGNDEHMHLRCTNPYLERTRNINHDALERVASIIHTNDDVYRAVASATAC